MTHPPVTTVSCAGADDRDDPADVAALAAGRPLVEIGLQLSSSREGTAEYPTRDWISRFAGEAACARAGGVAVRAALHVNGAWCRDICSGRIPTAIAALLAAGVGGGPLFQRVQLNFDAADDGIGGEALPGAIEGMGRPVILQAKAANADLLGRLAVGGVPFDVLFDSSGGNGVRPGTWPAGMPGRFNAWAGGLGPDTADRDVPAIAAVAAAAGLRRFGLDAQRNLRSPCGMHFDTTRAAAFADAAAAWNAAPPGPPGKRDGTGT